MIRSIDAQSPVSPHAVQEQEQRPPSQQLPSIGDHYQKVSQALDATDAASDELLRMSLQRVRDFTPVADDSIARIQAAGQPYRRAFVAASEARDRGLRQDLAALMEIYAPGEASMEQRSQSLAFWKTGAEARGSRLSAHLEEHRLAAADARDATVAEMARAAEVCGQWLTFCNAVQQQVHGDFSRRLASRLEVITGIVEVHGKLLALEIQARQQQVAEANAQNARELDNKRQALTELLEVKKADLQAEVARREADLKDVIEAHDFDIKKATLELERHKSNHRFVENLVNGAVKVLSLGIL